QTVSYDAGGTVGNRTSSGFWMNFDLGNTTNEAGVGTGDSGGGAFYNDRGTWKLAGINTEVGVDPVTKVWTSTFAVSVPEYAPWIGTTIPEPATMSLLVLGGVATLRRRNRR
ncbi:MAG: PEP-CTERM sorting domain-containing protein, partial [Planctomycetota bacterium]